MIEAPRTPAEKQWCREFLKEKGQIRTTEDAHYLVWLRNGVPTWVVSFDAWLGYTCQMQMASAQRFVPRQLIFTVFNYAFNILSRKIVFAVVNSKNSNALRLDLWLGFQEFYRAPECAEDGGDIIALHMKAEDWKARHGRLIRKQEPATA